MDASNFALIKKRYKVYEPETFDRKLSLIVSSKFPAECLQPFLLHTVSGKVEVQLELVRHLRGGLPRDVLDLIIKVLGGL